jgi:superfamily II DNA or RNA helicase
VANLLTIDDFDNFVDIREFPPEKITAEVLNSVRKLDEKEELEPFVRSILFDTSDTPHGPAEIVDILTHKLKVKTHPGLAAFILKGKSFPTVRPKHVAHQIYRLEKISGLRYAVFAAVGTILDEVREQFCATAERLECKYALFDSMDIARLLVSYGFLCPRDGRRIAAGRCGCGYSPKKRILNVLQSDALKALYEAHELGQSAGLVVLPPGSGKTRIAAEDSRVTQAARILYVAHTHEILSVAASEFEALFGKENVTIHNKRSLSGFSKVNIATIQLLSRHLDEITLNDFDYVIIDEFHHAAAKSYRSLIEKTSPNFLLGLTATPFRGDRQDIRELCQNNTIVSHELRTGIETGILSPYHYFGCFDDVDYSSIPQLYSKYSIQDLERALIIPERHEAAATKWRELAKEKITIAFCCSHKHAKWVAQAFRQSGITAEVYLSSTSSSRRVELTDKLRSGSIRVLCVVDVLNEGADLPFIECLLFLRPTESKRIFYQQLGRGLRRYVGKSHCTVIDFIGNFKNAYLIPEYQ